MMNNPILWFISYLYRIKLYTQTGGTMYFARVTKTEKLCENTKPFEAVGKKPKVVKNPKKLRGGDYSYVTEPFDIKYIQQVVGIDEIVHLTHEFDVPKRGKIDKIEGLNIPLMMKASLYISEIPDEASDMGPTEEFSPPLKRK